MTPSGSRSGFAALSFHNTLCGLYMHTDAHRLRLIVDQCYLNVEHFVRNMVKLLDTDSIIHPDHSLTVCFPRPSEKLMIRYQLMPVSMPRAGGVPLAGICILVNVDRTKIDNFLADYSQDMRSC